MQKVLILEDSKTGQLAIKSFLKKTLGEGNFDSKYVDSAEAALNEIDEYKPTLMTVDVVLTGMDGIEFAKQAQTKNTKPKIIIVSSKEFDLGELQTEIPQVKAVIKKPVTLEKFSTALETARIK